MGEATTLRASDGQAISAYRALPAGRGGGAFVIAEEVFGLNRHVRSLVDQYAGEGYEAIAPALFDRAEPGVELGYTHDEMMRGRALRGKIPAEATILDI